MLGSFVVRPGLSVQYLGDFSGQFGADSRNLLRDGFRRGFLQGPERTECPQEFAFAVCADAGNFVEFRLLDELVAQLAVVGDGEAVRFVAQGLQHAQAGS